MKAAELTHCRLTVATACLVLQISAQTVNPLKNGNIYGSGSRAGNQCNSTHKLCAEGSCVQRYPVDCPDYSSWCQRVNILVRTKQCADKTCISLLQVCDGTPHCPDGSDEKDCAFCHRNAFLCDNADCINERLLCNGVNNCGDNSDEKTCQRSSLDITTAVLSHDEPKPRTGVSLELWLYIICITVGIVLLLACCCCCCLNMSTRHKDALRSRLSLRRHHHIERELTAVRVQNDYIEESQLREALSRVAATVEDRPPSYDVAQEVSTPLITRSNAAERSDVQDASSGLLPTLTAQRLPSYEEVVDSGEYVALDQSHFIHRSVTPDNNDVQVPPP